MAAMDAEEMEMLKDSMGVSFLHQKYLFCVKERAGGLCMFV